MLTAKRKDKYRAISKASQASLRKQRIESAKNALPTNWSAGQIRTKNQVRAAEPVGIGAEFDSRDTCELYVGELYESTGQLTSLVRKNATSMVIGCSDPNCGGRYHFRATYKGPWVLTCKVDCNCTDAATVTSATGSTAIPTRALVQLVKPLVEADPKVTSKVIEALLTQYMYRLPNPSLVQRLRMAALHAHVGDPLEEVQKLPAYVQALKDCGHHAELNLLTVQEYHKKYIEMARKVMT